MTPHSWHMNCPVHTSDGSAKIYDPITLIGDKWTLRILLAALDGTSRFADFHDSLGIARNILSSRLRLLVEAGLLERRPIAPGGARMGYMLTEKGRGVEPVLHAVREWADLQDIAV